MSSFNAIYYYNANEFQARVSLEKDRLCIHINEEQHHVIWYYDQIKNEQSSHVFYYPGYPLQSLNIPVNDVAEEVANRIQQSKKKLMGRGRGPFVKAFLGFLGFLVLAYFFLLPWLAAAMVNSFPDNYEKQIGESAFASMKDGFEIDESRTAYINDFFRELHFRSRFDVRITVVKNDVANAFALPGGHIVVHDKILTGINSYEELAALLSHEFTHVENRHTLRGLFRQLSFRILLTFLLGDADAVGTLVLSKAEDLKSLAYSRSLENEADEYGARLLAKRHIDCSGFVRLFETLKKERNGVEVSEWMSSHPFLDKRIQNIRKSKVCRQNQPIRDTTLHTLFLKLKTAE